MCALDISGGERKEEEGMEDDSGGDGIGESVRGESLFAELSRERGERGVNGEES
jgi:hypothetical protein